MDERPPGEVLCRDQSCSALPIQKNQEFPSTLKTKKQTKPLRLIRLETWTRLSSPLKAPPTPPPHHPWFRSDFSREEPRTPDSSIPGRPGAERPAGKPRRGAGDAGSLSRGSAGCREEKKRERKRGVWIQKREASLADVLGCRRKPAIVEI